MSLTMIEHVGHWLGDLYRSLGVVDEASLVRALGVLDDGWGSAVFELTFDYRRYMNRAGGITWSAEVTTSFALYSFEGEPRR